MDIRGLPSANTSWTAWKEVPGCTVNMHMLLKVGNMRLAGYSAGSPAWLRGRYSLGFRAPRKVQLGVKGSEDGIMTRVSGLESEEM